MSLLPFNPSFVGSYVRVSPRLVLFLSYTTRQKFGITMPPWSNLQFHSVAILLNCSFFLVLQEHRELRRRNSFLRGRLHSDGRALEMASDRPRAQEAAANLRAAGYL